MKIPMLPSNKHIPFFIHLIKFHSLALIYDKPKL